MIKKSEDQTSIQNHFYRLIVPEEILSYFEIEYVEEKDEELTISLVEKGSCLPNKEKDLVLNGYFNPIELTSFPINGKRSYLRITRRKWKLRGTDDSTIFSNTYDFTTEGTKATKGFGAFLKEIGM